MSLCMNNFGHFVRIAFISWTSKPINSDNVKWLFSDILMSEMDLNMKLRMIAKNYAADQEIGFLTKKENDDISRYHPVVL